MRDLNRAETPQAGFERLQKTTGPLGVAFWELSPADGPGFWSPEMRSICGCDEEAPASRAALLAVSHPDDRDALCQFLNALVAGQADAPVFAHRVVRPSGEVRSVESSVTVERDSSGALVRLYGATIDHTMRARAEQRLRAKKQELRDSEARYRSVVLAMTDGIVVHGADGDIVTTNPSAERVLGLTARQMMGRDSMDPRWRAVREDGSPFPGDQHPGHVTLKTGEPFTGVIMGVHTPDDELRWLSINTRRVMEPGEQGAYSVVASFTDVTHRRLSEEKVQASLREKEVLLREVHHRVKNNLQIVSSLLYMQSTVSGPEFADLLRESQHRVASMALVHAMLYQSEDLSKIPFGEYVQALGQSLGRAHGVDCGRVGLVTEAENLILAIDTAIPCGLLLNEILSNSFKHAFPGDSSGTIKVSLTVHGDAFHLVASDDGVGLPQDFEKRRASSLGSLLIDRLAEQIGGTLLRSEPGQPTRYELHLPNPVKVAP